MKVDIPSSSGIASEYIQEFRVVGDSIKSVLDSIPFQKEGALLAKIDKEEQGNP